MPSSGLKRSSCPGGVGGTWVSLPHLAAHPSCMGTGAALASLEREREIHHKHPVRWLGKPALELGPGGMWPLSPHPRQELRGSGRNPPWWREGRRLCLGWPCGGTVPALNVNVGSSAEQTTRGCPILQGRGRGAALAHQVTVQHPPAGVPRASCARGTQPTSWQSVNIKPHHEHTIK